MVEQLTFYTINTGALTTCVALTSHHIFSAYQIPHYSSVSVVILMLVSPPPGS